MSLNALRGPTTTPSFPALTGQTADAASQILQRATGMIQTTAGGGVDVQVANLALRELFPAGLASFAGPIAVDALRSDGQTLTLVIRRVEGHADAVGDADEPAPAGLPKWRLKRALDYIEANLGEPVSTADLAAAARLSPSYFAVQFRQATGLRPHDYLVRRRIDYSKELLEDPRVGVLEAAIASGFQTQAHFTTVFRRLVGQPPCRWRRENCVDSEGPYRRADRDARDEDRRR